MFDWSSGLGTAFADAGNGKTLLGAVAFQPDRLICALASANVVGSSRRIGSTGVFAPDTQSVLDALAQGGAMFFGEIAQRTRLLQTRVEEALGRTGCGGAS